MTSLTIASFTLREAASRRLLLAGLLLSLAFVALFALGYWLLYSRALQSVVSRPRADLMTLVFTGTILTTMGLYAVHFLSSFIALFLSVGAISGEIDAGTLHALLARPIRRWEFVLGRWLAYASLLAVYVAAMAGLLLLVSRLIAGYEAPDPARAIGLMIFGSLLLLTLSLLGSSLLTTMANGIVVFSLFGLAWLAGVIESLGSVLDNDAMLNLGVTVSLLVPSDGLWRGASYYIQSSTFLAESARRGAPLPFASLDPPAPTFLLWSAAYVVITLGAAMLAFARRDL